MPFLADKHTNHRGGLFRLQLDWTELVKLTDHSWHWESFGTGNHLAQASVDLSFDGRIKVLKYCLIKNHHQLPMVEELPERW